MKKNPIKPMMFPPSSQANRGERNRRFIKAKTPLITSSISRSPLRYGLVLIPLVLAALVLSPTAQAQLSPPPDGGYAGDNTAEGTDALFSLTTGNSNTASGYDALLNNTTGIGNIALGNFAGANLTTGDNNIDVGNVGVAGEANTIRIGTIGTQTATYIAGIMGKTAPMGTPVFINANGQLGTTPSSARFKDEIKPMDKASEAILALKPVTFHYKKEFDPEGVPQFGLVAEDVAKVNPDLVVRDAEGKVYTVRYDAVNAMLLNEFLKEHRTLEEQKATIAQLKQDFQSRLAEQQKQIQALTAGLQKVSTQLELSKPAAQTVVDNH